MSWVKFEQVKVRVTRKVECVQCKNKAAQSKTFICTVNPFNRGADGTPLTRKQVQEQASADAARWEKSVPNYVCRSCRHD